ncbi:MAG TPA: hypothetical protein VGX78_12415 [Pirellulales bacterium]|nr:hypothetical protein [Pirellulales bacterium]
MAKLLARYVKLVTPKRRWAQFSLGTLFLIVTALCVAMALVVAPAERQRRAVAAIEALDGRVVYSVDETAIEAILGRWLPRGYLDEVEVVSFRGTQVTDTALVHLHGLARLQHIHLDGTDVTDAGLAHLRALTGLEWLSLDDTQVTDAGLVQLHVLTRLQTLLIERTQITDAGLAHLHEHTRLQEIHLDGTQLTDAGLAHLQGLTGLESLTLHQTQVTDAGLAQLQEALPNCAIYGP